MSGTPMKLILTQEVDGLGSPGEVVEVAARAGGPLVFSDRNFRQLADA